MCLMFTLFYTQMRRVLVEREIKNLQTTFDQAVDDVNTELALHQSMSDYLAFDQTIDRETEHKHEYFCSRVSKTGTEVFGNQQD